MANPRSDIVAQLLASMRQQNPRTVLGGLGNLAVMVAPMLMQMKEQEQQKATDASLIQSLLQNPTSRLEQVATNPETGAPINLEVLETKNPQGVPNSRRGELEALLKAEGGRGVLTNILASQLFPQPEEGTFVNGELRSKTTGELMGPAKPEDEREYDPQNIIMPDGDTANVLIDKKSGAAFFRGPDSRADLTRPVNKDFLEFSGNVQTDKPGDLGADGVRVRNLKTTLDDTRNLFFLGNRVFELTTPHGAEGTSGTVGVAAFFSRAGEGLSSQLNSLARTFGKNINKYNPTAESNDYLLGIGTDAITVGKGPDGKDITMGPGDVLEAIKGSGNNRLYEIAQKSTALRTTLVSLAYMNAKAFNEGGRLSDADFMIQWMKSFAQDMQSVNQIRTAVSEMLNFQRFKAERAFQELNRGQTFDFQRDIGSGFRSLPPSITGVVRQDPDLDSPGILSADEELAIVRQGIASNLSDEQIAALISKAEEAKRRTRAQ